MTICTHENYRLYTYTVFFFPSGHIAVRMEEETFYEEPSHLPFVITPAFITSLVLTFLAPYVISPLLGPILTPKYHSLGDRKGHFNTLLSSTVHAIVASTLTMYILAFGLMGTNRVFSKSPIGFMAMQISLGYLVADFIVCLGDQYLRKDLGSMAHHIAGILGLYTGLYNQGKYLFYIVYRLISELSTPFVNLRWVLQVLDEKNSPWYLFASLGMMVTFAACRIIVIPWHWYDFYFTLVNPGSSIFALPWRVYFIVNFIVFDILNIYWFSKMIKGAVKLYRTRGHTRD